MPSHGSHGCKPDPILVIIRGISLPGFLCQRHADASTKSAGDRRRRRGRIDGCIPGIPCARPFGAKTTSGARRQLSSKTETAKPRILLNFMSPVWSMGYDIRGQGAAEKKKEDRRAEVRLRLGRWCPWRPDVFPAAPCLGACAVGPPPGLAVNWINSKLKM